MFLSKAAKVVKFVINLNLHFVLLAFLGTLFHNIKFFNFYLDCYQIRFRTQYLGFFKQIIVFVGVELSTFTSPNFSKNKTQNKVNFSGRNERVEDFFKFLVKYLRSNLDIWKLNTSCLPFHISVSTGKC